MADQTEKPTALVVDDEEIFRSAMKAILPSIGFGAVAEAADGETAVALYREKRPGVVFLDVNMLGELDGVDTLQEILDVDPAAVVVMLSAIENLYVHDDCINYGAKGFIQKGVNVTELAEEIHRVVSGLVNR